jgi:hypothetical protein
LILIDADAIDIIAIIEFYADIASQRFHCCRLRHWIYWPAIEITPWRIHWLRYEIIGWHCQPPLRHYAGRFISQAAFHWYASWYWWLLANTPTLHSH